MPACSSGSDTLVPTNPPIGSTSALGRLPLGQVTDKTGKETAARRGKFADRELHRKGLAVFALSDDDAADADDAALARAQIARQIVVVRLAVRRRHQHLDVAPDHLIC